MTTWRRRISVIAVSLGCILLALGHACSGLPHGEAEALKRELSGGHRALGGVPPLTLVRLALTDDGDELRSWAYVNAARGRPFPSWYVRPLAGWEAEWSQAGPVRPREEGWVAPTGAQLPYRDFAVEYPPAALWLFESVGALAGSFEAFTGLFRTLMAAALFAALLIAARSSRLASGRLVPSGAIAMVALGTVSTHRYDAVVALCLVATLAAVVRGRPWLAGIALGAGIGLKVVPLLVVPLLVATWVAERRWRELLRSAGAALGVLAMEAAAALWLYGPRCMDWIAYQTGRPLEIESTGAALAVLVGALTALPVAVSHTHGSLSVIGPWAEQVRTAVSVLHPLALLAVSSWAVVRALRAPAAEHHRRAVEGSVAVLLAFMLTGPVFSPQYLVWLLPWAVLLPSRGLLLAALLLSQVIFPFAFPLLAVGSPWTAALVLLRGGVLVTWLAWGLRVKVAEPALAAAASPSSPTEALTLPGRQ